MVTSITYLIVSGDHQSQAFKKLNNLREKTELCDITLKVNDTTISAHKVVLAACSEYFNFMFTGNVSEKSKEQIQLNNLQTESVLALIEYIYSGSMLVTEDTIINILTAADFLQIKSAKFECLDFLSKNLRPSNCVKLKQLAKKHYFNDFEKKVNNFIRWNFADVIKSRDFLELSPDTIKDFLGDESFRLSESSTEKGISTWIRHDTISREVYKDDLKKASAEHVRESKHSFLHIYDSSLQKRVYIINEGAENLSATFYDLNNSTFHRIPSIPGSGYILPTLHNNSIFLLNKNNAKYAKYDMDEENWTLVQPFIKHMKLFRQHLPLSLQTWTAQRISYFTRTPFTEHFYSGACSYNDRINLIADRSVRSYSYNVERNVLYSQPDLLHDRSYPGIACDDHCIYVCGGGTNAAERLDYRTNKWKSIACLPVDSIKWCTATALGSNIYCTSHDIEGFFQFDTRIGIWTQKANIPNPGNDVNKWSFSTISSTDDTVYAANSCGIYKYSVAEDRWTTLIAKDLGKNPICICYVPQ